MKLLHIDSSILGDNSTSRVLTKNIVAQWLSNHPGTEVDYLDLAAQAPAHFDFAAMGYRAGIANESLSPAQRAANLQTDALIQQFLRADVVVLGAPMYNFSVPSQLKAWVDRIAQPGFTFKYGPTGAVGLATGKTVVIASTRGGAYSTSDAGRALDHQEGFLQAALGFLGVTDLRIVRAEGLATGPDARKAALEVAALETKAVAAVAANDAALAKVA